MPQTDKNERERGEEREREPKRMTSIYWANKKNDKDENK